MAELRIPARLAEIDPAWLRSALSDGATEAGEIVGLRMENLNEEMGFVSQMARLVIDYAGDPDAGPASVVAKLAPTDPAALGYGKQLGLFQKEVAFYQYFATDCPANPPHCYHAAIDDAAEHFVLLIEDLGVHDGTLLETGASLDQAKTVVATLGRLHGRHWHGRGLDGHDWIPRLDQIAPMLVGMAQETVPVFLDRFGHHMPPALKDGLFGAMAGYGELLSYFERLPDIALCHVDTHLGNMTFEDGDRRVRFFDWQAFMINAARYDLAYFINGNLTVEDRREFLPELLACYHEALVDSGIADLSLDQVHDIYHRQAAMMWVTIPLIAGGFLTNDERGDAMAEFWLPRHFSAMEDSDAPAQLTRWREEMGL